MKKNLIYITCAYILISMIGCYQADAEVVGINNSTDITLIDPNTGNIIKGPSLNNKNLVPIRYGKTFTYPPGNTSFADTTAQAPGKNEEVLTASKNFPAGTVFRTKNMGIYKNKSLVLAYKNTNSNVEAAYMMNTISLFPDNNYSSYEIWIEDENKQKIIDDNVLFLLPIQTSVKNSDNNINIYSSSTVLSQGGIKNYLLMNDNNKSTFQYGEVDYSENKNVFISKKYSVTLNGAYVFKQVEDPLIVNNGSYKTFNYPDGILNKSNSPSPAIRLIADPDDFVIPYLNPDVYINNTYNQDTYRAKLDITQVVYAQNKDNFYKDLKIQIKVPDVVNLSNGLSSLVITDSTGKNIRQNMSVTADASNTINIVIPSFTLKQLRTNNIKITGNFTIDNTIEKMKMYDLDKTGIFTLPVIANNSDNLDSEGKPIQIEGSMQVKIPAPTGEPVKQEVYQGTSTDNLDPNKLVKNMKSIFTDDTVTISGFKTSKTFDTIGSDNVIVEIQSATGVKGEVIVPITVEKVTENASMSWSASLPTITKSIQITKDKSDITETLPLDISWKTSIPGRQYSLVTKDQTGKIITSQDITNDTTIDSFVRETVALPIEGLSVGECNYVLGIYAKDSAGKITGNPLDTLNLKLMLTGSLKLLSIPTQLNWTDRTVIDSKGTLARDTGNEMTVKVADTRDIADAKKNWSVSAIVQLTDNSAVPFDLRWKNTETSTPVSLKDKQTVLNKETATKVGDTYTGQWNEQTGIVLYSADYLKVGDYSKRASILWQLYDTPSPD